MNVMLSVTATVSPGFGDWHRRLRLWAVAFGGHAFAHSNSFA